MNTIAIDTETFYSTKNGYGIKENGAWHYVNDPERFDCYMVSVCDGETSWAGHPKNFNWETLRGAHLVSHNFAYDGLVFERLQRDGCMPADLGYTFDCSANLASFLCNRRSLAQSYEFLYGEEVSKEVRAKADGRPWDTFSPAERQAMLDYARGDAVKCWRIWNDHSHRWPQWERDLSNMTIEQGWRGVAVNWELVDKYLVIAHGMLEATDQQLPWVKDGGKPTSPKAIAEHCRRMNIPAPPVRSHDEDAFLAWEAQYAPLQPWIRCVSTHRSLNTLLKLLTTIKSRRRPDDTMPFSLRYFGSHTGRWSGDAGINLQNQRKDLIFRNEHGLMETDDARCDFAKKVFKATGKWPEWVTATINMRSIYIPRPGKKFIIADASQIEPRVLNWFAGNHELLGRIAGGMSIYEAFAREFMGWTGGELKKENADRYKLAKAQVLGLGYGCGWEKFISVARLMADIDITADDPEFETVLDADGAEKQVSGYGKFSRECVNSFRAANPKITALWRDLDDGFKSSIRDGKFEMGLPSGRVMQYREVKREVRMRADENGKVKKDWYFSAEIDGRRYGFYGGALTENLVQATSRDIFGTHLLAVEREGLGKVVFHVHDEMVVETDPSTPKEEIVRVMSQTPEWMPGLSLSAEAVDADHYQK